MSVLVLSTTTVEISNPATFSNGPRTPLGEKNTAIESLCWSEAKAHFRRKHIQTSSGAQKNELEKNIERFLKNNNRIDETISECKNLKSAADRQYNHSSSGSPKFIRKLLDILVVVKSVGDPLLQCAPESVSIAWSAISLLINLGVNDLENCGRISEACTSIVTIVLNCRLYENRYQNDEASAGIISSIQQLLAVVLDFFWFASKKLRDKKIKRLFRDIFDQTVDETYQDVITRYKALREDTDLAFQERVVDSLQELKKDKEEIISWLFPPLQDITTKLEAWAGATKDVLTEVQVNNKFESYRRNLKPTDTHQRQLEATIEPLSRGINHLCKWLFKDQHYQSWERLPPKTRLEKETNLGASSSDGVASLAAHGDVEAAPPTNVNFLYIKGRAGFGKSVTMATVIKRLQSGFPAETEIPPKHAGDNEAVDKPPVLFFFFKKGDDATQLTSRAFSSLVAQLFDDNHAKTREAKENFIRAIDSLADSTPKTKKDGNVAGRASDTEPKEDISPTTSNKDLLKVESLAREIGKTVYIVIDGIDECTNYESEGLVGELIKLGRSKYASFKIIMSSREGLNFEHQFSKENDPESQSKFTLAANHGSDPEDNDPLYCVTHGDATILTVTKEANSEDMKEYLEYSLRELMKRRTPEIHQLERTNSRPLGKRDTKSKKKLDLKIRNMAKSIQQKSDGMFTYSAMVITNLSQPSPLSLGERLDNLPTGMNELYYRQLEALTSANKTLVMLALKRIMWSPTDMGTVELAEEFKQVYFREEDFAEEEGDTTDSDDNRSVDGSVSGEEDLEDTLTGPSMHKTLEVNGSRSGARPLLHRAETYLDENPIEKAMRNVNSEIHDTIFHLRNAGRDFFKFSKDKQTIGLIHKSVRDWFESESEIVAQCDRGISSIASLFSRDSKSREVKLTLPIPWVILKGQSDFMEFQSKKDAHLDILIYNLKVLIHPRFQRVYLPEYPDGLPGEAQEDTKFDRSAQTGLENGTQQVPRSDEEVPNQKGSTRSPGTFHKGPWRCEIHHWVHHMHCVGQLWPREERKGERWMELQDVLRKFVQPQNFRRWLIQYLQYSWNESLEVAYRSTVGVEPIHVAGFAGLEVFMEFLIMEPEAEVSLQKLTSTNRSALNYVEMLYFPETVKLVLQKGIDINIGDDHGRTPFTTCFAASEFTQNPIDYDSKPVKNLIKSLWYLIEKGADLNRPLENGIRPLQAIIIIGDESLFNFVMERGEVDVNLSDTNQRTALHSVWASPNLTPQARVSIAQKLLEAGADPNAQDCESKAPLLEAALSGSIEGVQLLLKLEGENKVNINDEDNEGYTALISTVINTYKSGGSQETAISLINLLIENGADIKLRGKDGWTAFRCAVWYELWDIVDVLMAAHSSAPGALRDDHSYLTEKDINCQTILHSAAMDESAGLEMAELVLKNLTPEEITDFLEQKDMPIRLTALHQSIAAGNLDVATYLLEHHAKSKGQSVGDMLLWYWMEGRENHAYALKGSLESWTELYLAILPTDTDNMFLHFAISVKHEEVIRQLAEAGIDPFKRDSENWDAFDWAYAYGCQEIMRKCFPNLEVDYQFRRENWKDTFNSITGWDRQRSHDCLEFLGTGNICHLTEDTASSELKKYAGNSDYRFLAVANHPISPYALEFYYEITIISSKEQKASFVALGLLGDGAPLNRLPGWDHFNVATYGFHGDDGHFFAPECCKDGLQWKKPETGDTPYGVGDTVGCGYDTLNHTVFWTLNGRYLGAGFEGVCYRLYPAIGTKHWFSVSTNFGDDPDKPFKWDRSRDLVYSQPEIRIDVE
ncbi:hypothetical protein TWF718_007664 [Orbilia javanica]|uniref:B30.2/SPRY domain-containing protein n=1 Tax=Orbilia javanica TaxID=47235 RepID=A0AAN8NWI3_9PEZI